MKRPQFPKEKDVLLVADYPITSEIDQDEPYSSASALEFLGELHKVGIKQKFCSFTYLSYERPDKENFDFHKSFARYKSLEPLGETKTLKSFETNLGIAGEAFYKLPDKQDDIYISETLFKEYLDLVEHIEKVKPKLIIVTGKWSLFFLADKISFKETAGTAKNRKPLGCLLTYRASSLELGMQVKHRSLLFPMLPQTVKYRMPEKYPLMLWDFRKVGDIYSKLSTGTRIDFYLEPEKSYIIGQDKDTILGFLKTLLKKLDKEYTKISVDIETRFNTIDCIGLSIEKDKGLCIAFSTLDNPNLWDFNIEVELVTLLKKALKHKNSHIIGQNFMYDAQFIWKFWGIDIFAKTDTMVLHHVMYNFMPKSLDILASIYCDQYRYWKDQQVFTKQEG